MTANKRPENRSQAPRRRRRSPRGVATSTAIVLIIIALLMGAVAGFVVARKTHPDLVALQAAQERIIELENTLTLIGFSTDDPEEWVYSDNLPEGDAASELSGLTGEEEEDLWEDDSLLSGLLIDDGEPVVVAEFNGGELLSTEVIPEYNDQLTNQIFAGNNPDQFSDSLLQYVLEYMVSDKIFAVRAEELGLSALDDADRAEIAAEADRIFEAQLEEYTPYVTVANDATEEEIRAAVTAYLSDELGVSHESITEELKETWWAQKFYNYIVRDVTASEEEICTRYEEVLADQRENFSQYPEEFEYAHVYSEPIVYRPAGYRAVRDIQIFFDTVADSDLAEELTDQLANLDPDTDADAIRDIQSQLDALYAPLEAKAQEALDKLNTGASFESLMDEYGCDEMLKEEPLRSEGWYISDGTFIYSTEFVEGCMMLEQPGDISAPLRSLMGVHLAQYIGEVPAGDVPLEECRDEMTRQTLSAKQASYYEAYRSEMLEQANVKYYPERLR